MYLVRCTFLIQGLKDLRFIAWLSCGITNSLIVRQWRHKSHRKQTRIWTRIREWKKESAWMHLSYDLGFDKKTPYSSVSVISPKLGNASFFPGNSCFHYPAYWVGHGGWIQAAWGEAEETIPSAAFQHWGISPMLGTLVSDPPWPSPISWTGFLSGSKLSRVFSQGGKVFAWYKGDRVQRVTEHADYILPVLIPYV